MERSVIVLGAGMVGVSVAVHLRRHGYQVALVDHQRPGLGASFGNGGLIQTEAVLPTAFPRELAQLRRIARNRSVDVAYHAMALPNLAGPLLRYWWNSHPSRYQALARAHAALIATAGREHTALAAAAGATALLRPIGWMRVFGHAETFEAAVTQANLARREFGVPFTLLDGAGIAVAEPHLKVRRLGGLHWTGAFSVADPHALTHAYASLFAREGGHFALGDAATLRRDGSGWSVASSDGPLQAAEVVVALGAAAGQVTRRLGYAPPLFGKRGYHMHYALLGNATLNRPVVDMESGFLLAPMRAGIRLTTGAEFARPGAPPTPVQLARAEPIARGLLPLAERLDAAPWMGVRPCTPDMLPVIGRLPGQEGAWCAFGHAHQGFTLGPSTGRLLAEMMMGEKPLVNPQPYSPGRFG
jgi:D-amino-acid dehydrogenase